MTTPNWTVQAGTAQKDQHVRERLRLHSQPEHANVYVGTVLAFRPSDRLRSLVEADLHAGEQ